MLDADYFDSWYAAIERHPTRDAVAARSLGLPSGVQTDGVLPWSAAQDLTDALGLGPGDTLADLACGRGAWGVELAARCGSALIGVDFSRVALDVASRRAARRGVDATFRLGSLTATGLPDASVGAVVCVDSMQFAEPLAAGLAEVRRVLAPGGVAVLTGWTARDLDDELVPARLRQDVASALVETRFRDVVEHDEQRWRPFGRAMWEAALAQPEDPDDPALVSMQTEGRGSLAMFDRLRRLRWVARA